LSAGCAQAHLFLITTKFPDVFLDPFKSRDLILEGEIQCATVIRYDNCEREYDHGFCKINLLGLVGILMVLSDN